MVVLPLLLIVGITLVVRRVRRRGTVAR